MSFKSIRHAVVRTFIVRVYRATRNRPDRLLGTTQEAGREGTRPFKNLEELWGILNHYSRQKSGAGNQEEESGGGTSGGAKKAR